MNLPTTYRHSIGPGLDYELVRVRKGRFLMGSTDPDAWDDEQPEHLVELTQDFYIGVVPVTQAVWAAVMDGYNPSYFQGKDRPVENVSWTDIIEGGQDEEVPESFLARLHRQFPIQDAALKDFRFRLPTEAEWEYTAKGGHLGPQELSAGDKAVDHYTLYAGSDRLRDVGWFENNSHGETKPVGLKQPNALGLFDMSGNVLEWCQDFWEKEYYKQFADSRVVSDPVGPASGHSRVIRGGSWLDDPRGCRVSSRFGLAPSLRYRFVGFRLVLSFQFKKGS